MSVQLSPFLSDANPFGMALLAPDLKVIEANDKIKAQYAIAEGDLFPAKTQLGRVIELSVRHGKGVSEFPIQEKLRERTMQLMVYIQLLTEKDRLASVLVCVCDVTSLHSAYLSKSREEKLRIIGEMAAGTADVILNPLAVIKGTLQLLIEKIQQDVTSIDLITHPLHDKLKHYITNIHEQVKKIDGVLQRFLVTGKPSELEMSPLSVHGFLQTILPGIQERALDRNITLICEYPNVRGRFLSHEASLAEVFDALLANAFEASPEGGTVRIQSAVTEQEVQFLIADQGKGITKDILHRVTDPFFTTKENALGFGLSFCENMIHKMGGNLVVQSSSKGTTVHVILPKLL